MTLKGQGIVVTGASQGLGKAIASACVREGADVLLCARDQTMLGKVQKELAASSSPGQRLAWHVTDVSKPEQVEELFRKIATTLPTFSGLVNNAGVLGPRGLLEDTNADDWWHTLEVNVRGTMNSCRYALPIFRKVGRGKIVNLSGGGATAPMPHFSAYAASKSAVVRLTETLAVETAGTGIDINAVAPGALNTRMLEQVLESGPEHVGADYFQRSLKQKEEGGASLENAAALCTFLLSSESDGLSGLLISAVWDPWKTLTEYKDQLLNSDVYRLRRIVPGDRKLTFG